MDTLDTTGKTVGVLVFITGMVLLGWVFVKCYHFPDACLEALQNGTVITWSGDEAPPSSSVDYEALSPLTLLGVTAGVHLLTLLVLGSIASLIAHKGAILIRAFHVRSGIEE